MYTFSTQLVRNALFDRDDCIRPTPAPDKAKQAAKGGFAVAKKISQWSSWSLKQSQMSTIFSPII